MELKASNEFFSPFSAFFRSSISISSKPLDRTGNHRTPIDDACRETMAVFVI